MPNHFAYIALFGFPLVAWFLFRRLPLPQALIWTILGGYLFLPERTGINLPMVPTMDKELIPALSAWVFCWMRVRQDEQERRIAAARARRRQSAGATEAAAPHTASREEMEPAPRRPSKLIGGLVIMLVMAQILTWLGNRDPIPLAVRVLPGISLYAAISLAMRSLILAMPFLLARRYLVSREAQVAILKAFVQAGLVYSVLMLVELRLSPRLHIWTYGFFQHDWIQHLRGGYRPIVFLAHGLRVGIFMAMCVLAAAGLVRVSERRRGLWLLAMLWLLAILLVSKNLGASALTLLLLPVALMLGLRARLLVAAVIAGMVLLYPMLRGSGLVPTDTVVSWAAGISQERADSLSFRLKNEDEMLAKARQRPLVGWGGFGRNFVFQEGSDESKSIPDGVWVLFIGLNGWIGYIAIFGLVTLPPILLALRRRSGLDPVTASLALVLAVNLADLIPNSSMVPILWLVAGTLAGVYERHRTPVTQKQARTRETQPRRPKRLADASSQQAS